MILFWGLLIIGLSLKLSDSLLYLICSQLNMLLQIELPITFILNQALSKGLADFWPIQNIHS